MKSVWPDTRFLSAHLIQNPGQPSCGNQRKMVMKAHDESSGPA